MLEIYRKSLLYKTGVEYGDYTINHALGCSHGCLYPCYAFLMARRFGRVKNYQEWCTPSIVSNADEILSREIPKLKDKIESVHLSFTTDPFMVGYQEIENLSLKITHKLNANSIKVLILTKGILPLELADLSLENEYGISLVSLNEDFRRKYEPFTANYNERIASLKLLHNKGYKTWVSMEPYPTPNIIDQDLNAILNSISFVDRIIFGRLHYNSQVTNYANKTPFYNDSSMELIEFCNQHNIMYHIKNKTMVL